MNYEFYRKLFFNGNHFFNNKFEFCALFPKVQKEIIVIIGPGTGKILLSMDCKAKFCCYLKFQSNLRGKKTRYRAIISRKPLLFSDFLKEEKNNSLNHMKLFYWPRIPDVLYIGTVTLLLMRFAENTFIVKFSFFLLGRNLCEWWSPWKLRTS
jgi:hypothetical protein